MAGDERLIFSKRDWSILRSLQRQVKKRYVTRVLLVIGLFYCVGMCAMCTYYAVLMFMGAEDHVRVVMPEVQFKNSKAPEQVIIKEPAAARAESQDGEISPESALLNNVPTVSRTLGIIKPLYERINFFNIGWASALHAALLFYLATRAFFRLRLLKKQTPRAKLALKMAERLKELGELHEVVETTSEEDEVQKE